jgi:predicted transcriptional regulator of viral defense system
MGRRSVYELRDKILSGGRRVLSLSQLSNMAGIPRDSVKVYASRLVKKGLASRVVEGTISLTDDPFVIATQLLEPSYVSLTSALYLNGLIRQVPSVTECVTTKNTRKFAELGIEYHRVHPALFFGYERLEKKGSYTFVATPEKALLDMVYLGRLPPHIFAEVSGDLDRDRLNSYSGRFGGVGGYRARRVAMWVKENVR